MGGVSFGLLVVRRSAIFLCFNRCIFCYVYMFFKVAWRTSGWAALLNLELPKLFQSIYKQANYLASSQILKMFFIIISAILLSWKEFDCHLQVWCKKYYLQRRFWLLKKIILKTFVSVIYYKRRALFCKILARKVNWE